jgi:type I restriction enzyme S subunit
MPRADWGFIGNISIFIPDKIEEQIQISNYISKIEESIDKNISLIEREMLLVNEYKASLVLNVVTGQVDVRNFDILEIEHDYDHEEDFDIDDDEEDEQADDFIDEGGDD